MTDSSTTKKRTMHPVKTIREGAVAASIWKRQAPSGYVYYDFSLSRSWKAQTTDKEGYSSNFFAKNEEQLHNVVTLASEWIARELPEQTEAATETSIGVNQQAA